MLDARTMVRYCTDYIFGQPRAVLLEQINHPTEKGSTGVNNLAGVIKRAQLAIPTPGLCMLFGLPSSPAGIATVPVFLRAGLVGQPSCR